VRNSRQIGHEVLALLGGAPGTFTVHVTYEGHEPVVVVEIARGRRVDIAALPKTLLGMKVVYRPQVGGNALAG
jgi:hypothetical protein